jgi:3-oxoacyl-[acyl-carrier protein] reductase
MRLQGRVAVVTGAGRGIGRAIVQRLAAEGARVAALDMNAADLEETLRGTADASQHLAQRCDISDSQGIDAAFAATNAKLGPIAILVNNAGIGQAPNDGSTELYAAIARRNAEIAAGQKPTAFPDQAIHMQDEGWRRVMAVNLDGAFFCCRAAIRSMVVSGTAGSIINIASTSAQSGEGPLHYVTSKAAIVGLTRGLARELSARRIRVNAVAPGPTNTPIMQTIPAEMAEALGAAVPLGRMARPEEVAAAVAFLASDDASYCTGSVLVANGGSYFF